MRFRKIFLFSLNLTSGTAGIKLWPAPGSLPTIIPARCRVKLAADINCGPGIVPAQDIQHKVPINSTFLSEYCKADCTSSITGWASNVQTACGDDKYDLGGGYNISAKDIWEPIIWARNVTCITDDKSHDFCYPDISNRTKAIDECSDCNFRYLATILSSSRGDDSVNEDYFTALASSCSVQPSKYAHPTISRPPTTSPTGVIPLQCDGKKYIVKDDDTCRSIAAANNLAIDRFITLNGLDYNCTILTPQQSIQETDTCNKIVHDKAFSEAQFKTWNPIIGGNCLDLSPLARRTVCISPPGSMVYDGSTTVDFNSTWTLPPGSWVPGPTTGQTATTTGYYPTIVTSMATLNATRASIYQSYIQYCPITAADYDNGFEWALLDEDCSSLLDPYCNPIPIGPTPTSTTFPESCMPSNVMGL
ncbi:hypothetical protein NLG97_g3551 [Lecanicillium saksenae]|uniref:Uncharacterized protein n=1 Tax=Lecanicillium saksenae TaxID=468837 RepID=A0ACC1QXR2_9HYPO|nr:hypothetical protein NLG97_g3551 [Lecanicillium saksenae]